MSDAIVLTGAIAIPVAGALVILIGGRGRAVREGAALLVPVALFALVASLIPRVAQGARPAVTWAELVPGLSLGLEVEPLGLAFATVASGLWIANSLYSVAYVRANDEAHQGRFHALFALALACAMGVAFAADLLTLLVFYELLTFTTYPLVTHHGGAEDRRAGRTYLAFLVGTSMPLLTLAIVWTWIVAGTTSFEQGGILAGHVEGPLVAVLLGLYVYGTGKAALMPVHRWLPAAMVAPTPVSALLHAVAVVKAGVFTVVKVVAYTFGVDLLARTPSADWLMVASGGTVIIASIVALRQDDLKRLLAYSTVSQLAYVVMAASIFTPAALAGAALHIVSHAFGKITLFFAAGAIYTAAHKRKVSELDGIGRRMPWTMAAFAIGALSMIGLPPAGGFVSKWAILSAAAAAERWLILAVVVISTVLTAAYFIPIVHRAFLRGEGGARRREAPAAMVAAIGASAALALAMFVAADLPLALVGGLR